MLEKVSRSVKHKRYSNQRGYFANYSAKKRYIYLSSAVKRYIEDMSGTEYADLYIDRDEGFILLDVNTLGEYHLSKQSSGYAVCLYGARIAEMAPGRHDINFIEDEDGLKIKVDFMASEGV